MTYKPELLAPAGDLNRLKTAILYGADAVFIGGKIFSLRAKASNFTIEDINEGVQFAHQHNAKIYVTVNIIPEEVDFKDLDDYLISLNKIGIDAVIVSSMYVVQRIKQLNCKYETHISTQLSTTNIASINFFKDVGVDRVVLGRELSMDQIKNIKENTSMPIEVFVHGGMCSSFSGRCGLSNFMVNRDANKGGCAHSCRWIYELHNSDHIVSSNEFTIASYDLMGLDYIPQLLDAKVDSFKIEGRMKSAYYIANVVRIYRQIIDLYMANNVISKKEMLRFKKEILKIENRSLSSVFLNPKMKHEGLLLDNGKDQPSQSFLGCVLTDCDDNNFVLVEQRNYFTKDTKIEIIGPNQFQQTGHIVEMYDLDGNSVEIANHAQQLLKIKFSFKVFKDSFIRQK